MAKIITVPNDNDLVMLGEMNKIAGWVVTNPEWDFVSYQNECEHISMLQTKATGAPLDILEFDCHGSPYQFNHTDLSSALLFGQALSRLPGFSNRTEIYLSACNTGFGPIAQILADAAGCTVFGANGNLEGTIAQGDATSSPSEYGGGVQVWNTFCPQVPPMPVTEPTAINSIDLRSGPSDAAELAPVIDRVMRTEPIGFPRLRIAPDLIINYHVKDRVIILDVFANGKLVKIRGTNTAWKVTNSGEFQAKVRKSMKGSDFRFGPFLLPAERTAWSSGRYLESVRK